MAIYQSFDALPDELKQRVLAVGQQRYGRAVSPEQLMSNGGLAQQLMSAAGIDIGRSADDVGMRDNLNWIDTQMEPAPPVESAKPASRSVGRASSGRGDRTDAQAVPLPPRRPNDLGNSSEVEAPLPPRRPADLERGAPTQPSNGGADSPSAGTLAGRAIADGASASTPEVKPKSRAQQWVDSLFRGPDEAAASVEQPQRPAMPEEESAAASMPDRPSSSSWRDFVTDAITKPPPTDGVKKLGKALVESEVPKSTAAKLQAAGINPAELTYGQKLRIQTMGIDRWIAENADQKQRDSKRRMDRAVDKSGR